MWERLSTDKKQEVSAFCGSFKFLGPGQSEQPVITFHGALKLIMFLPGETAKQHRSAMVNILSRYFAGDPTLLDEIDHNAKSDSVVAQMARASLAPESASVEDNPLKRKREELEIRKIETEVRCLEIETYRELCMDTTMDERARQVFKDSHTWMDLCFSKAFKKVLVAIHGRFENLLCLCMHLIVYTLLLIFAFFGLLFSYACGIQAGQIHRILEFRIQWRGLRQLKITKIHGVKHLPLKYIMNPPPKYIMKDHVWLRLDPRLEQIIANCNHRVSGELAGISRMYSFNIFWDDNMIILYQVRLWKSGYVFLAHVTFPGQPMDDVFEEEIMYTAVSMGRFGKFIRLLVGW